MVESFLSEDSTYSSFAGFTFLFNLIVGTGTLTLPAAFQHAGWLVSLFLITVLCFLRSFVTFTFVVEALSITNALNKLKLRNINDNDELNHRGCGSDSVIDTGYGTRDDIHPVDYEITEKSELGQMFLIFFGRLGNIFFYINICVYLFGDLSIYSSAVPKSLRNVICSQNVTNLTLVSDFDPCWTWSSLTRLDIYRIFVTCFGVCMCPFLFYNVTRSRWLQMITIALRWIGFSVMLILAIERAVILSREIELKPYNIWNPAVHSLFSHSEHRPNPPIARPHGILNLFGVSVYVFMCHHSIPGLISPIRNKKNILFRIFIPTFFIVLIFNLLLAGTAVAAFNHIEDIYTLNFFPNKEFVEILGIPYVVANILGYFLCLFPVFAISSSFPIVGTTLLGNIRSLCNFFPIFQTTKAQKILRYTLPFIVLLPPLCIALSTNNVNFLAGFTGAVFGSGIQYIIPTILVFQARKYFTNIMTHSFNQNQNLSEHEEEYNTQSNSTSDLVYNDKVEFSHVNNDVLESTNCFVKFCKFKSFAAKSPYSSPFQHFIWIIFLLIWAVFCVVIVLIDKIHPL